MSFEVPLELVQKVLDDPDPHLSDEIERLEWKMKSQFPRWMAYLSQGLNLVLHGFGSKRQLLEAFVEQELSANDYVFMVVRGYMATVSGEELLGSLADGLNVALEAGLGLAEKAECLSAALRRRKPPVDVTLVVHSLDGPSLREPEVQTALSLLAASRRLHLIASVDHVNASLLWDQVELSRFRWLWIQASSFRVYSEEIRNGESRILGLSAKASSTRHTLASLETVWVSLARNTRLVFVQLVKACLDNRQGRSAFGTISFWNLFQICRTELLVSREVFLEHQIVEFKDHQLISVRKGSDGADIFSVAISRNLLFQFLRKKGFEDVIPDEDEDDEEQED